MPEGLGGAASGIVLAGGQSRRLGRNKAVEPFAGQPLLRRALLRVAQVTAPYGNDCIVVAADESSAGALPLLDDTRVVLDLYPGLGSLGGIFSGLSAARHPWAIVAGCDMPFLNPELLRYLLSLREGSTPTNAQRRRATTQPCADGHWDVVAPVVDGRPEPLHAVYSRACLPHIEERLKAGQLKITGFYDKVRVRYVEESEILRFDPELLSFFNVNSPDQLEQARALAAEGR